jgi:ABC-type Mn2+/Zn2+ transport system ATPase subunit
VTDEWLLSLERVTVGYGRQPVLQDVNLRLERGSFTGLLGANGSGKSTLLKTVLGILPPLGGALAFARLQGAEPVLGYVPQSESYDPLFLFSAFEVVVMGACGRVGPGRRIPAVEKSWANECLRVTGMAELRRRRFAELSGGQKQRVLIARALAARPDLLVLDEPTAGVDPAASQAIMELLRDIHGRGVTILMTSHNLPHVRQYARRVIWLHEGKVLHGPVHELLSRQKIEEILSLEIS